MHLSNQKQREQALNWRLNNRQRYMWLQARSRARRKGLVFKIEQEDIVIPKTCPILGIPLCFDVSRDNTPSLDRINNELGYVVDNIHVISSRANRMKSDVTVEELKLLAEWIGTL